MCIPIHICIFPTFSAVNRQLVCFPILPIVNNVAMKMGVQISLQVHDFSSLGYIS